MGFSSATRVARYGEGSIEITVNGRTFVLTGNVLRLIDMYLERWRRAAHEAALLRMNGGRIDQTLCDASWRGGVRDVRFLLLRGADASYVPQEVKYPVGQSAEAAQSSPHNKTALELATMAWRATSPSLRCCCVALDVWMGRRRARPAREASVRPTHSPSVRPRRKGLPLGEPDAHLL